MVELATYSRKWLEDTVHVRNKGTDANQQWLIVSGLGLGLTLVVSVSYTEWPSIPTLTQRTSQALSSYVTQAADRGKVD